MLIDLSLLSFLFLPFSVFMVTTFWHPPVSSWNPHILYFSSLCLNTLFQYTPSSPTDTFTQTICIGFSLPLFSLHFPFATRRRCGGRGKTLPILFLAHWISPSTFISIYVGELSWSGKRTNKNKFPFQFFKGKKHTGIPRIFLGKEATVYIANSPPMVWLFE